MLIQFFMHTYMHVGVYIYLLYIHTYNHYICVSLNITQSWVSSKFFLFFTINWSVCEYGTQID